MVKRLLCFVPLMLALAFAAEAQDPAKSFRSVKKVVIADTRTKLAMQLYLHPDCSPIGKATIRITRQPKSGKTEVAAGMEFPGFPSDNIRSKCNSQQFEAPQVWYTPEVGYKGKDTFEYEMIGPQGQYRRTRVEIEVK